MELMTVGGHGGHGGHGGQDQALYRSSQAFMTVTEDHRHTALWGKGQSEEVQRGHLETVPHISTFQPAQSLFRLLPCLVVSPVVLFLPPTLGPPLSPTQEALRVLWPG